MRALKALVDLCTRCRVNTLKLQPTSFFFPPSRRGFLHVLVNVLCSCFSVLYRKREFRNLLGTFANGFCQCSLYCKILCIPLQHVMCLERNSNDGFKRDSVWNLPLQPLKTLYPLYHLYGHQIWWGVDLS